MMYHVRLPQGHQTKFRCWNGTVIDGGDKFNRFEGKPIGEVLEFLKQIRATWVPVPEHL